jgi:hypothetical protein
MVVLFCIRAFVRVTKIGSSEMVLFSCQRKFTLIGREGFSGGFFPMLARLAFCGLFASF